MAPSKTSGVSRVSYKQRMNGMRPECVGISMRGDTFLNHYRSLNYRSLNSFAFEAPGNATVTTTCQGVISIAPNQAATTSNRAQRRYVSTADAHNKFRIVQCRNRIWCRSDRYSPGVLHGSSVGSVAIGGALPDAATFCYLSGRGVIT